MSGETVGGMSFGQSVGEQLDAAVNRGVRKEEAERRRQEEFQANVERRVAMEEVLREEDESGGGGGESVEQSLPEDSQNEASDEVSNETVIGGDNNDVAERSMQEGDGEKMSFETGQVDEETKRRQQEEFDRIRDSETKGERVLKEANASEGKDEGSVEQSVSESSLTGGDNFGGMNPHIGEKRITLEDGSSVEAPEGARDLQDYKEYLAEQEARVAEAAKQAEKDALRIEAERLAGRIVDSVDERVIKRSLESGNYEQIFQMLAGVDSMATKGDQISITQNQMKMKDIHGKYSDGIMRAAMEFTREKYFDEKSKAEEVKSDEEKTRQGMIDSISEVSDFFREKVKDDGDSGEGDGGESATEGAGESAKGGEDGGEKKEQKTVEEITKELGSSDAMDFLMVNGLPLPGAMAKNDPEKLREWYDKYVAWQGWDEEKKGLWKENWVSKKRDLEKDRKILKLEIKDLDSDMNKEGEGARWNYAERSAKARGVFGRMGKADDIESGGRQREMYEDAARNWREESKELVNKRMELWKSQHPEATQEQIDARHLKYWQDESDKLTNASYDRMGNGNLLRKLGKMKTWQKVSWGVMLSAGIGVATGGLGLVGVLGGGIAGVAGAAGASGLQAAVFSRMNPKHSAINANRGLFKQGEKFEDEGDSEEKRKAKFIKELSEDEGKAYDNVAQWITDKHTEAILADKLKNRWRTAIAVGSAVALTLVAHYISGLISNNASATSGGEAGSGGRTMGETAREMGKTYRGGETSAGVEVVPPPASTVEPPVPELTQFSPEALTISSGEGFFQTLREAGIGSNASEWRQILADPAVREQITGSGLGYITKDGLPGLNLGADDALRPFLEVAKQVAESKGF